MITLSEARQKIAAALAPLFPVSLPLAQVPGAILREPLVASADSPLFARSAMDGYAVSAEDLSARFRIVAELQADGTYDRPLTPGECVRVHTGTALPTGASQVIIQEDVCREGEWMRPLRRDSRVWIRSRGEDFRAGARLLEAGATIGPSEAALFAQLGIASVLVSPQPKIVHLVTGRELRGPGEALAAGQIRDSNSTLVAALLSNAGATLACQSRVPDEPDAIARALSDLSAESWNLLLISGGASVGDYDFGARSLTQLGFTVHFHGVSLRPGKPLLFATRGAAAAFVLPGNPVSHFVTFHVAVRAALQAFQAAPQDWPVFRVPVPEGWAPAISERESFWPAKLRIVNEELRAEPVPWKSSGDLSGLTGADALLQIAAGAPATNVAGFAACLPLRWP